MILWSRSFIEVKGSIKKKNATSGALENIDDQDYVGLAQNPIQGLLLLFYLSLFSLSLQALFIYI